MRIGTICAVALLAGSAGALEISGVYDVDVASGASQTISEAITGSGSIRKTGAGTLVLSGANTFTGGVTLMNFEEWLRAGAIGAGIGGYLSDKKLIEAGDWAEFTRRAKAFCDIVAKVRG